jgi:hypothetical protein
MHKILFVGAILSTFMLVQAKSVETTKTEQTTASAPLTNNNEELKAAYERAQKDFDALKDVTHFQKTTVKNLALIPAEKDITDFPAPLAAEENDQENIIAYYKSVAAAYEKASKTSYEQMHRAHMAASKHGSEQHMKTIRHDGIKLPDDVTTHKSGHLTDDKAVPYKSASNTPISTHADAHVLQNKRYNQLKTTHDTLEMKYKFYAAIAKELQPAEVESSKVTKG